MINCDICNKEICKYELDYNSTGAVNIHNKNICYDCAKKIAIILIED